MVTVELRLLGPPFLSIVGQPVQLHSVKTIALLAYLAIEARQLHSREKLATLLWGNSPDSRARQSLRQSLYSLRRALGDLAQECLHVEHTTLSFNPHPNLSVDIMEFIELSNSSASDLNDLREAMQLYRGPLLEGVELAGCPEFSEWLFFQRDSLEQRASIALQTLVTKLIEAGNFKEALPYAQRFVRLDSLYEGAHRHLMQIYAAFGNQNAVRHQYQQCIELLAQELGVEPTAKTQALYDRLISETFVPDSLPPLSTPPITEPSLDFPFIGRETELATLQERLRQPLSNLGGLILIEGDAGTGKTQLVNKFMRWSTETIIDQSSPLIWLTGRCYELEAHAPYTMWADALHPLGTVDWQPFLMDLPEVWLQQISRLIPDVTNQAPDIEGATADESRLRLLQGVVRCLAHLSRSYTLLIFFDDVHWADEASLELLHYASRHLTEYPVIIIGTYDPEAGLDTLYLQRLLRGDNMTIRSQVLKLAPLSRKSIHRILIELGFDLPEKLIDRLHHHSAGNPFILTETVNTLLESGALQSDSDSRFVQVEETDLPLPQRVQELVRSRLSSISDDQRRLLSAAAVIGRAFGLRLLHLVSGQSELLVAEQVGPLLARSFLLERGGAHHHRALDFQHDYVRRVIYQGLNAIQRQALHRRAARALLDAHQVKPERITEEVAYHYEQAGDERTISYLVRAGRQADRLFAYAQATDWYSRALSFHYTFQSSDSDVRFDILLAREAVLERQGRRAEQANDVKALQTLAKALADPSRLATAVLRQAGLYTNLGQYGSAREAGEQALALYREIGDKTGEAQVIRELGFLHWSSRDYGTALAYSRHALRLHRQLGDIEGEATALHNLGEIYRSLNSPRQALAHYEQALNLHWARQDHERQGLTHYGLAHALRQMGDLDGAFDHYQQSATHCRIATHRLMESRVQHALASLQWDMGDLQQAIEHMNQAVDISLEIGYGPGIAHSRIALSYLYTQHGEAEAAEEQMREAISWLRLMEDDTGLREAQSQLDMIEEGVKITTPLKAMGWVKSHVALTEGKVYCEFESPMAQTRGASASDDRAHGETGML